MIDKDEFSIIEFNIQVHEWKKWFTEVTVHFGPHDYGFIFIPYWEAES